MSILNSKLTRPQRFGIVFAVIFALANIVAYTQQKIDVAKISAQASGPQDNTHSDSVVISPYQLAYSDKSGSVTTGGTSQTLSSINTSRHAIIIVNPALATDEGISNSEPLYINFTSSASAAGSSIPIAPGGSYVMGGTTPVTIELISVTAATTGHKWVAKEQ